MIRTGTDIPAPHIITETGSALSDKRYAAYEYTTDITAVIKRLTEENLTPNFL